MTELYTGHDAEMEANTERKLTNEEMQAALLREIQNVLNVSLKTTNEFRKFFNNNPVTEQELPLIKINRIKRLFEQYGY